MEGLAQIINTVKLIKQNLNTNIELEGILLTMYDGRNNLSKLVAQEIKNTFPDDTFKTIIPRNVKLSECSSHGKTIIIYDIASKGSEAYLNVTKEIILKVKERSVQNVDQLSLIEKVINKDSIEIPSFDDYQLLNFRERRHKWQQLNQNKNKQTALGRGMSALLGASASPIMGQGQNSEERMISNDTGSLSVPIEKVKANKDQPRKIFKDKEIAELAASIKRKWINTANHSYT